MTETRAMTRALTGAGLLGVLSLIGACRATDTEPQASPLPAAVPTPQPASSAPPTALAWGALVDALSEPEGAFFSDTPLSNEDAYPEALPWLARAPAGSVYIGVGPEQNLTFIAQMRPALAFVIDIRRANLLLHLLFRALFIEADDAVAWLCKLLGRQPPAASPTTSPEQLLERVSAAPKVEGVHEVLLSVTLEKMRAWGLEPNASDEPSLRALLKTFYEHDLELRYQTTNADDEFVSLRELVTARDAQGVAAHFLTSQTRYDHLRQFQREGRLVPVVADLAGPAALQAIGRELLRRELELGVFYASNVEQYLLIDGKWAAWQRNLASLPSAQDAVLLRSAMYPKPARAAATSGSSGAPKAHWSLRAQLLSEARVTEPTSYRALFEASRR